MKNIDKKTVLHIAHLSRLALDEKELDLYSDQLASILSYINKLDQLDTSDTPPTSHALSTLKNIFRKDIPRSSLKADEAIANAPQKDGDFFKVPTVIEGK